MSEQRPFLLRFGKKDQIAFAKRLAMLLRSGIPLSYALSMLRSQADSPSSSYVFSRIAEAFSRGKPFSTCLAEFPNIFGTFAVTIVQVGENSASLHESLAYLGEELKKHEALRKKIIGALVYPAVIVCATVGISIVLTVEIFPKILPVFRGFKQQLPFPTRVLIALSDLLINDGWTLVTCLVFLCVVTVLALRLKSVRRFADRTILWIPILAHLARSYAVGSAVRTTGLLLRSGTPIVQALRVASESAGNSAYHETIARIAVAVGEGDRLSTQLARYPRLFPRLAAQMIQAGEESGDLAGALLYVSEMYEEDITDLTRNLTTLLEPILMLAMGAVVGFVAISIIAPIYGITQNLSTS